MNRKIVTLLVLSLGLTGCVVTLPSGESIEMGGVESTANKKPVKTTSVVHSSYKLDDRHWADVASIKAEGEILALKIASGELSKIDAARQLGVYRLRLVGSNPVDDDVYRTYLNAAMDSANGVITNAQSRNLVKNSLQGWQNRWKSMSDSQKPRNPAFTNFLNETMGLPYLK